VCAEVRYNEVRICAMRMQGILWVCRKQQQAWVIVHCFGNYYICFSTCAALASVPFTNGSVHWQLSSVSAACAWLWICCWVLASSNSCSANHEYYLLLNLISLLTAVRPPSSTSSCLTSGMCSVIPEPCLHPLSLSLCAFIVVAGTCLLVTFDKGSLGSEHHRTSG
jgi:hypothetical protein